MSDDTRLRVVLCWHMHQPDYRDLVSGEYRQPWTYLHAIKDYVDMAAHLEANTDARAVVNFAPVLLEQIVDYAEAVEGTLQNHGSIPDPLLSALADPALPTGRGAKETLIASCLRANETRMIHRFPAFERLAELARVFVANPHALDYVSEDFLSDLLVWYHLAWIGETVRREDLRVKALMQKQNHYTLHERRELLTIIGEILSGLLPRYRALAEAGRAELSLTPYAHPIVPLLLDIRCGKEAMPDAPLPSFEQYPGGEIRARWHMEKGIECFQRHFGFKPQGCWPSEGGVSDATMALLDEFGFRWAATGESVLHHSIDKMSGQPEESERHYLFQPHRSGQSKVACFFRDDRLSDQIGFVYADWHADDAVANLVHHLENIADSFAKKEKAVVSIIMDGENAWEHYPENGYYFLNALYAQLASHPKLQLSTFSQCLDDGVPINQLPHLVAGSWVYGTFSTWIGEKDKNRGWEMLADAKQAFDAAMAAGLDEKHRSEAEQQLAVCEGSDWFWWFGGDNPAETVRDFDELYRMHLSRLYQILRREPPDYLSHPFTFGGGKPAHGGTMKRGQVSV
jgi:alpha-amylase/alpha-mannosidase (GH57 family)